MIKTDREKRKKSLEIRSINRKKEYLPVRIAYQKEYQKRIRLNVFNKLGNICIKCGFSDIRALQIDHVSGNGNLDRKYHKNWYSYYMAILKDKTNKYQLLCANCNQIKKIENKEF